MTQQTDGQQFTGLYYNAVFEQGETRLSRQNCEIGKYKLGMPGGTLPNIPFLMMVAEQWVNLLYQWGNLVLTEKSITKKRNVW